MRTLLWLALAAALWLPACGGLSSAPEEKARAQPGPPTQQEPDETLLPSSAERAEIREKVEAELKELDARIEDLSEQAEKASGETREALDRSLEELEVQRQAARKKLKQMMSTSDNVWEELKTGTQAAGREVKKTYRRIRALL